MLFRAPGGAGLGVKGVHLCPHAPDDLARVVRREKGKEAAGRTPRMCPFGGVLARGLGKGKAAAVLPATGGQAESAGAPGWGVPRRTLRRASAHAPVDERGARTKRPNAPKRQRTCPAALSASSPTRPPSWRPRSRRPSVVERDLVQPRPPPEQTVRRCLCTLRVERRERRGAGREVEMPQRRGPDPPPQARGGASGRRPSRARSGRGRRGGWRCGAGGRGRLTGLEAGAGDGARRANATARQTALSSLTFEFARASVRAAWSGVEWKVDALVTHCAAPQSLPRAPP